MTARMRKALELIASGEGPQGGFLTRLQMMGIAREAVKLDQMDRDGYDTFTPEPLTGGWILGMEHLIAIQNEITARASADYTAPTPEWPLPPLVVRDLLK